MRSGSTACLTTVGNVDDGAVAGSNIDVVSVDLQVGDEDFRIIRRSVVIASDMAICIYIVQV